MGRRNGEIAGAIPPNVITSITLPGLDIALLEVDAGIHRSVYP